MDIFIFIFKFLTYFLVVVPICTMLHEVGHASMILLLTNQKVTFQFGARGRKWEIRRGRLTIIVYLELLGANFCIYQLENKAGLLAYQDFWITLGGPLASLLLTFLFGSLWWVSNGSDPWTGLTVINFLHFLNSSIPRNYPAWQGVQGGIPNDGRQIVQLIQQSRRMNEIPSR